MMRRILGVCLLILASATAACAAIEIGVRALHLVPTGFFEPDPLLGARLIPGRKGWWTQEELEFRTPVQINREGFRDIEHVRDKPTDVTRVLILGDSYVEAMQVPLEATIARQLEAALNNSSRKYEVISMGVSGFGTAGELLLYQRFGRAYHPDVVVLSFYPGNDIRNNSPALEPAMPPVYASDGSVERIVAPQRPRERGVLGRLLAWSQTYRFLRKRIVTLNPAVAAWLVGAGFMSPRAIDQVPAMNGVPLDYWVYAGAAAPDADKWEEAWRHTERLLDRFRAAVEADGARFIVSIATMRERIYPDSWETILKTYPAMQRVSWDLAQPEARIQHWCRAHEVRCVALTSVFLQHREERRLHWVYDGHWTAAGHALAATTLATAVRDGETVNRQKGEEGA